MSYDNKNQIVLINQNSDTPGKYRTTKIGCQYCQYDSSPLNLQHCSLDKDLDLYQKSFEISVQQQEIGNEYDQNLLSSDLQLQEQESFADDKICQKHLLLADKIQKFYQPKKNKIECQDDLKNYNSDQQAKYKIEDENYSILSNFSYDQFAQAQAQDLEIYVSFQQIQQQQQEIGNKYQDSILQQEEEEESTADDIKHEEHLSQKIFVVNVGEIFYFKRKINNSRNIFKGYSECLSQKVVGVMMNKASQNYIQLNIANRVINHNKKSNYFNVELYQITYKCVKSQYKFIELYQEFNENSAIYSIQKYYKGSLYDLIQARKKLNMPFSQNELKEIFNRLILLGKCLEDLKIYHENFTPSKILLNFNKKTGKFDSKTMIISSLQNSYIFNNKHAYFSSQNYDFEQIQFTGYISPEIYNFDANIFVFKQNSYAIGLFMLNCLTFDLFTDSSFLNQFNKGMQKLENENLEDDLKKSIFYLLKQQQEDRYTCSDVIDFLQNRTKPNVDKIKEKEYVQNNSTKIDLIQQKGQYETTNHSQPNKQSFEEFQQISEKEND